MKKVILPILGLLLANVSFAQLSGIGIHFGANDFYGPQTGKYFTDTKYTLTNNIETNVIDTSSKKTFRYHPFVRVTYWHSIGKHFDVNLGLSAGNVDYPSASKDADYIARRKYGATKDISLLLELDARFNYNILDKAAYICSPYLFAGISGSHHPIYFGATIPLGAGLNFNLSKDHNLFLNLETAYKVAASSHDQNHLQHSIGFVYWYKAGYREPKAEVLSPEVLGAITQVKDMDGDGIEDAVDKCPTIPGEARFDGCPDTDGDGIGDADDQCPLVAGLAQFHGCPDSDNDGIPDNIDKCPYAAGPADRGGCPVPDRDGDGFPDDVDRCPDVYSKTNGGCPEVRSDVIMLVDKAAKAIFFESGKATIKKISYKSLDIVANILKGDATLFADVEGHTDNVKPKSYTNMELSQRRADAVRDYLIAKGISADRITAKGFGETQPVASNDTAPGRAQNRRTLIKLRNYIK
ncbi:MAG: OmpA family protein [Chitinophagaceae bacterium]